ncbi:ATP-grasp domain-containing protein [Bacillus thermotolerans]|uniref:ATP-grasp domain-containing protein n=1 Tax=Bacillus thermotolerans TaxID=1221996 RepID=A0A0F5HRZ9_BACTR|nr:ATP-grasp domain-containing protein [Bacillus thermotolerans]KKB35622.1 hypothetical protein QY97_01571 [Bacillus thermotolerans]KKB40453.1 hypothetical protein QY95_01448 [Bacillus thermotolerans]KKB41826.1 hypothetical protein QY96_01868 [Bacillus thermotolerans]
MEEMALLKEQRGISIRPSQTIQEIYGSEYIYSPKLYAQDYEHFAGDVLSLEALTGRELCVAGNAPVICHEGAATEAALQLLHKAGLHTPSVLYTYRTDEEYIQILHQLQQQQKQVIFQYPHPDDKVSPDLYWVKPEMHAYLCDKQSIPELVPPENVPGRRTMSLQQLLQKMPSFPFVLKSGDGRPTSGGSGVLFVEKKEQLYELDDSFCDLSNLIVEEFISHDRNMSVHYTVNQKGDIKFLGQSEQLVNKDGCFRGSWISSEAEEFMASIVETGYWIMKKAADKGYVGAAGFDVLIRGNQYYFIDLNVRFNASTCGLLLYPAVRRKYGTSVVRLCNLEWTGDFNCVLPTVKSYIDAKQFVPLSLLDASYFPDDKKVSKVVGLILGHSVEEIEEIINEMTAKGLYPRE